MPGARPPRMGAQEYEENLRAGRLSVSGFANVLGGAVSATLFGYLWRHEQRAVAKGAQPVEREKAWHLIAERLEMSASTLNKIAFGRRYPSLDEIERLLAMPRIGELLATNIVLALASEASLLQNMQELFHPAPRAQMVAAWLPYPPQPIERSRRCLSVPRSDERRSGWPACTSLYWRRTKMSMTGSTRSGSPRSTGWTSTTASRHKECCASVAAHEYREQRSSPPR